MFPLVNRLSHDTALSETRWRLFSTYTSLIFNLPVEKKRVPKNERLRSSSMKRSICACAHIPRKPRNEPFSLKPVFFFHSNHSCREIENLVLFGAVFENLFCMSFNELISNPDSWWVVWTMGRRARKHAVGVLFHPAHHGIEHFSCSIPRDVISCNANRMVSW